MVETTSSVRRLQCSIANILNTVSTVKLTLMSSKICPSQLFRLLYGVYMPFSCYSCYEHIVFLAPLAFFIQTGSSIASNTLNYEYFTHLSSQKPNSVCCYLKIRKEDTRCWWLFVLIINKKIINAVYVSIHSQLT